VTPPRKQALLWLMQRASAAVLALCVVVHIATMVLAVRGGLTADDILSRTRGSIGWTAFYAAFVIAVSVHAPIGARTLLAEWSGGYRRGIDLAAAAFALLLLATGLRAVYAVTAT
jgi:fumarate reductase subunit C